MKSVFGTICGLAVLGMMALPALAEDGPKKDRPPRDGAHRRPSREDILKKFDKDGDGELSPQERKAAKEAFAARQKGQHGARQLPEALKKRLTEKYDANENGKLDPEEFAKARADHAKNGGGRPNMTPEQRKELMKKFDKDGNGKLDEKERGALMKHMREKHGQGQGAKRGPGQGGPGQGGPGRRPGGPGKGGPGG